MLKPCFLIVCRRRYPTASVVARKGTLRGFLRRLSFRAQCGLFSGILLRAEEASRLLLRVSGDLGGTALCGVEGVVGGVVPYLAFATKGTQSPYGE